MRLKNKKAVIIGGNRGIGKAIALAFGQEGADVIITYAHNKEAAEAVVNEINALGRSSKAIKLDLSHSAEIKNSLYEVEKFFQRIDILVISSGILTRNPFTKIPEEDLDLILNVNFRGPFIATQIFAEHMIKHHINGSIIHISSVSAHLASKNLAHYECSKAALSMLSRSAALELAQYQIRVNTIEPGLTATDINKEQWQNNSDVWQKRMALIPLGRSGLPKDHVGAAIFLASDESSWVTGSCIVVDGGQHIKA